MVAQIRTTLNRDARSHARHAHYLTDTVTSLATREPDNPSFTFFHSDRDAQTITAGQLHHDATGGSKPPRHEPVATPLSFLSAGLRWPT